MNFFLKKLFAHLQNAWKTERPEEFVKFIRLDIPDGANVEDPTKNSAFMARIGAKQRSIDTNQFYGTEYVLTNAVTGKPFAFVRIDYTRGHRWLIQGGE